MNLNKISDYLSMMLKVLILVRIVIIGLNTASTVDTYGLFRHGVYTLAWGSIMIFLVRFSLEDPNSIHILYVTKMKKASFWAMILCAMKFIVTLIYQIPFNYGPLLTEAYCIIELIVWLGLTVFFFYFWKWKKKQEAEVDDSDERIMVHPKKNDETLS